MDHVSTEILILIFTHLHRLQKLQCMLVCRKWASIIQSGLDLESVAISSSPSTKLFNQQYKCLIERVLKDNSAGKKCKRLVLDHHSRIGFDKVSLAELFPNLTFLALLLIDTKSNNNTPKFTQVQSDKLESWRMSLETLIERSYTKRLLDFLETGVFRRLTTLAITPDTRVQNRPFSEISRVLKNTPALKNIRLSFHHIDLFELGELHKNVPTLASLVINSCRITLNKQMPLDMQPATTVKTLKISDFSSTLNLTSDMVRFFISTYTHLQSLSLVLGEFDCANYSITDTHLESLFTELVTNIGRHLIELEFKLCIKTPQVHHFLEKRASQLKHLDINTFLSKKLLYRMISVSRTHHLDTLSLVQVPPLCFSIFRPLSGLKVLQLAFKRKMINWLPINLNDMIPHLPAGLDTLELAYVKMDVLLHNVPTSSIKRVKLAYTEITERASGLLSTCFSKIQSLIFYYCRVEGGILDLSNHCLSYVHLVYYERHYCVGHTEELDRNKLISTHLKLTTGDTTRYYLYRKPLYNGINPRFNTEFCDVHDHSLQNLGTSCPHDESLKYLHFKSAKIQSFYYNGYLLI